MDDILKKLAAPFPPASVSWRVGPVNDRDNPTKGIALAYVDARDVQDRFSAVCGAYWQNRFPLASGRTVCEIGIKDDSGEWLWRADGAGDTDMEAEKGGLSDAFKRAAVKWGVGRYLYDVESPWVAVVKKGKSVVIAESEFPKLQKLLPGSKAQLAPPSEPKNAPGVSEARTWVREHLKDLGDSQDGAEFMIKLADATVRWTRICGVYPNVWVGPDGSGLRGEAQKYATIFQCRHEFDAFVKQIETAAVELRQPQQAAQ